MTNANDCAYPADSKTQTDGGLTKREYFAALAMQGYLSLLADSTIEHPMEPQHLAQKAVQYADALIAELNSTSK